MLHRSLRRVRKSGLGVNFSATAIPLAGPTGQRRGAAVIEFAIVAPLLFLLILGMIEFGRMIMVQQILTNGAREGARKAVLVGTTQSEVTATVNSYMSNAGISGHSLAVTPDPGTAQGGQNISVSVSVPYSSVSWLPPSWLGSTTLSANVVMRKEAN